METRTINPGKPTRNLSSSGKSATRLVSSGSSTRVVISSGVPIEHRIVVQAIKTRKVIA